MSNADKPIVLVGPEQTALYQILAQRAALRLEVRTGGRFSRRSVAAQIRRQHGLTAFDKAALLEQFDAFISNLTNGAL